MILHKQNKGQTKIWFLVPIFWSEEKEIQQTSVNIMSGGENAIMKNKAVQES